VRCEGQLEDAGVCDAVWQELMALDAIGAGWAANGEGIMQFERGRHLLYRATLDWIANGSVDGVQRGELIADVDGKLEPLTTPAQAQAYP